jgi:hypothetical protein
MRTAIVTIAIGAEHEAYWWRHCRHNWQSYADRCGYDLIPIHKPLDDSNRAAGRSPAWQKLLVLRLEIAGKYDRIVLLDSDIVINRDAPPIVPLVPLPAIGAVISGGAIHPALRNMFLRRTGVPGCQYASRKPDDRISRDHARNYYTAAGLTPFDRIINTGVLVLASDYHSDLCERIYALDVPETRSYEQIHLSHAILSAGLLHELDARWNWVLYEVMVAHAPHVLNLTGREFEEQASIVALVEFDNAFFLHFAYDRSLIRLAGAALRQFDPGGSHGS